jgi:hypothetical protein
MWNYLSELWCKKMHNHAMWPIHGRYVCQDCLREYPVAWEGPVSPEEYADPSLRAQSVDMENTVSLYR